MQDELILQTINQLAERMDHRFDKVDAQFERLNGRVRKAETDITKIKTAGVGVATVLSFFGWDYIRPWLTSLTR